MALLISGVFLWCVVHFVPTLGLSFKQSLIKRIGLIPYKGLFTLLIFASLVLMIVGWNSVEPVNLYDPPEWGVHANNALMLISIYLLVSADRRSMVRRLLRHPMLIGLSVWGIAHLLANGDQRSLIVFGALSVWALVEIPLINAREGAWIKPDVPGLKSEIITMIITAVVIGVITSLHDLAGLSPFPIT
jgi:uncharacterized membrane protein